MKSSPRQRSARRPRLLSPPSLPSSHLNHEDYSSSRPRTGSRATSRLTPVGSEAAHSANKARRSSCCAARRHRSTEREQPHEPQRGQLDCSSSLLDDRRPPAPPQRERAVESKMKNSETMTLSHSPDCSSSESSPPSSCTSIVSPALLGQNARTVEQSPPPQRGGAGGLLDLPLLRRSLVASTRRVDVEGFEKEERASLPTLLRESGWTPLVSLLDVHLLQDAPERGARRRDARRSNALPGPSELRSTPLAA